MTEALTPAQLFYLGENLNPNLVAKRSVGGQSLSYMKAYGIKATLIRIFGFGGFSSDCIDRKLIHSEQVPNSKKTGMNWKVVYEATVTLKIHQTGATYTESAIADGTLPDYTEAADAALKSAESDALKRAAIFLGTQFGLSLYENGQLIDVVGPVWAPDQIGKRDEYMREMWEAQQRAQQQMPAVPVASPAAQQVQDPYMAQVAAGLKVDERDGANA